MKTVNIYTDGACRGNPGDGGWGALVEYQNFSKEYFGGQKNTCLLYTSPSPRD